MVTLTLSHQWPDSSHKSIFTGPGPVPGGKSQGPLCPRVNPAPGRPSCPLSSPIGLLAFPSHSPMPAGLPKPYPKVRLGIPSVPSVGHSEYTTGASPLCVRPGHPRCPLSDMHSQAHSSLLRAVSRALTLREGRVSFPDPLRPRALMCGQHCQRPSPHGHSWQRPRDALQHPVMTASLPASLLRFSRKTCC